MSTLPYFRHMIKAIGDHVNPKETAYHYKIIEFQPNGRFIIRPAVFIKDTLMRADTVKLYEVQEGKYRLMDTQEFRTHKTLWDAERAVLGYTVVNDEGE